MLTISLLSEWWDDNTTSISLQAILPSKAPTLLRREFVNQWHNPLEILRFSRIVRKVPFDYLLSCEIKIHKKEK